MSSITDSSFELIIAIGVLHHINDETLNHFLKESSRILKPGGRLTTFDPVFHKKQSKFTKWVISRDRGTWVRNVEGYTDAFMDVFPDSLNFKIYSNLLRIPYDHICINVNKEG